MGGLAGPIQLCIVFVKSGDYLRSCVFWESIDLSDVCVSVSSSLIL